MYKPPRPAPLSALSSLIRAVTRGDGNLLNLLPGAAYEMDIGPLGWSRRSTLIVNRPDLVRDVLIDENGLFPKSDLMVNALDALIGNSIFVSSGETWRRQRAMVDPSLTMMRINRAFPDMQAGVAETLKTLSAYATRQEQFSLDLLMSHLTADIICRTVFSTGVSERVTHEVFEAFTLFEKSVAQVEIFRLVIEKAFTKTPQQPHVLEACRVIRKAIGELLDTHTGEGGKNYDDIASALMLARDEEGNGFTREELIDQLGVMFLAGHETSASALTWAFFILSQQPDCVRRIRAEVDALCGDNAITFEQSKKLTFTRNVFREVIRLYPPITFLPRVAMADTSLGSRRIKRGALVIVAPWVLHRHKSYWRDPDLFDPDRFSSEREHDLPSNAYIPFGLGPRICSGAAFASVEAVLIIASLIRAFDIETLDAGKVTPAARLTTRPTEQILCRVKARLR